MIIKTEIFNCSTFCEVARRDADLWSAGALGINLFTLGLGCCRGSILLDILEITEKALAEIRRKVVDLKVGLEEQAESFCIHILYKEIKQRCHDTIIRKSL